MFSKQRGMKLIKIISTYLAHACSCVCVFFLRIYYQRFLVDDAVSCNLRSLIMYKITPPNINWCNYKKCFLEKNSRAFNLMSFLCFPSHQITKGDVASHMLLQPLRDYGLKLSQLYSFKPPISNCLTHIIFLLNCACEHLDLTLTFGRSLTEDLARV